MFERFTDRARRAVVFSQEEARALNHGYIGTEHLLLGLLREGDGVAGKVLTSAGIRFDDARARVLEVIGEGKDEVRKKHIPFTPRAKKVLELSLREALQLGHNYIGTEHILLGLIREAEGVAAQVLTHLGADLHQLRASVVVALSGHSALPRAAGGETASTSADVPAPADLRLTERERTVLRLTLEGRAEEEIARALSISSNTVRNHKRNIVEKMALEESARPPARIRNAHASGACPSCGTVLRSSLRYEIVDAPSVSGEGEPARVLLVFCMACGCTIDGLVVPADG